MKKDKRLLKINDNFSLIEVYLDDFESPDPGDFSVLVIVSSRTFSGRYTCRFNRGEAARFSASSLSWFEGPGEGPLLFSACDDALGLEVRNISPGKVSWMVTCKPFLDDIEVLTLRLETEANLVRALSSWADRI